MKYGEVCAYLRIVNRYWRSILEAQTPGESVKRYGHNRCARVIEIAKGQFTAAWRKPKRRIRVEYFLCNKMIKRKINCTMVNVRITYTRTVTVYFFVLLLSNIIYAVLLIYYKSMIKTRRRNYGECTACSSLLTFIVTPYFLQALDLTTSFC